MAKTPLIFSVGLEIHARLKTRHKIFCRCANRYGAAPNSNTCPVCLGLPGSLPVLNPEIIQPALRAAVALNCEIQRISEFSRKNYFYPDLPRNYQITQYERPLALAGFLVVGDLRVNLQRIHLEEDAGRSRTGQQQSRLVDLNRAGTPLIEIVTEPDLSGGDQARVWLSGLRQLLRYLDVCDGNLETGSFRCDANVGLPAGNELAGPWVELKNLNSFKAVQEAVNFEIRRLDQKMEVGQRLQRETRNWDPRTRQTKRLRFKEDVAEYRYYPDPDLPLLVVEPGQLKESEADLPELPAAKQARFRQRLGISAADAVTFCRSRTLADYFESCVNALAASTGKEIDECGPLVSGWVLSHVLGAVGGKDENISTLNLRPEKLAEVLTLLVSGKIHRTRARQLIEYILKQNMEVENLSELVQALGEFDEQKKVILDDLCEQVLAEDVFKVVAFREGKNGLLNYFVGQVMTRSEGRLEAEKVRVTLLKKLNQ